MIHVHQRHTSSAIVCAIVLAVGCVLPTTQVSAQGGPGIDDFGAETIETEGDIYSAALALPVELVEEQSTAFDAKKRKKTSLLSDGEDEPAAAEISQDISLGESLEGSQLGDEEAPTTTILNVSEAEITTLIKTFSKLTKRNYIVDSAVKGKITVHLTTPVTLDEALKIFDSVLLLKGYTTVPIGDNFWKVVPAKDARQTTIPLVADTSKEPSDTIITHLARLKYVSAADKQKLISQFVSKDGIANSFSGTNALILIDSQANIERLKKLIAQLDVPPLDQEITIIPVLHAAVTDIAEKIKEILGEEEERTARSSLRTPPRRPTTPGTRRTSSKSRRPSRNVETKKTLPLKIIPDERTNSLIIVADEDMTNKVRALVERLDSPVDLSGGRFFVYNLKHADAEQIAEIINNLISGATQTSDRSASGTRGSSLTRASRETSRQSSSVAQRLTDALRRRRRMTSARQRDDAPGGRVTFEGEISVAADPATNSLIINASRSDYLRLKALLDELDVKRRQVLVEATLIEVSLNEDEGMGIELQGSTGGDKGGVIVQTNYGGLANLITNPAALSDLTIAAASSGTITLPGGLVIPSQALLLSALSRVSNVNVLSAPTIVTTDNEEAEIIVGENVPFVTSTSTDTSNINNTFNSIERQDVGITLRITPQISTGDFVTLDIFVEISNVVAGTRNDPNGPTTTIRTTETTVVVRDGQMTVTSGLISDNITESTRGIPFLEDIPVLGNYFKREDTTTRRKNLLIFITPKVFKDQYDAREQTKEMTSSLQELIDKEGIEPDRREILNNRALDRVTESLEPGAATVFPTPITPPLPLASSVPPGNTRAKMMHDGARELASLVDDTEPVRRKAAPRKDAVIDVTVKPKLPGAEKTVPPKPLLVTKPPPRLVPPPKKEPANVSRPKGAPKTYVVLRDISESDAQTSFAYADDKRTLGMMVRGRARGNKKTFFEVGRRYTFRLNKDSGEKEFICLGLFDSMTEAATIHPSLNNAASWNVLSPQETLLLGRGPWSRG